MKTIKISQESFKSFNHDKDVVGITQEDMKTQTQTQTQTMTYKYATTDENGNDLFFESADSFKKWVKVTYANDPMGYIHRWLKFRRVK